MNEWVRRHNHIIINNHNQDTLYVACYSIYVTLVQIVSQSVSSPVHRVKDSMNEEIKKIYDKMDTSDSIKIQQLRKEEEEVSKKGGLRKFEERRYVCFTL